MAPRTVYRFSKLISQPDDVTSIVPARPVSLSYCKKSGQHACELTLAPSAETATTSYPQ